MPTGTLCHAYADFPLRGLGAVVITTVSANHDSKNVDCRDRIVPLPCVVGRRGPPASSTSCRTGGRVASRVGHQTGARQDGQAPADTEGLLYLGFAGQWFLALDGKSGEVLRVHNEFGARPFAPGLESFVRALGAINGRVRNSLKKGRELTVDELLTEVSEEFRPAGAEPAWRGFLADIVTSAE